MIRSALLCCAAVASVFSQTLINAREAKWHEFKLVHMKAYRTESEENYRRQVWLQNYDMITKHNLEADYGHHSYRLGINKYSDWTSEEYAKYLNGFRLPDHQRPNETKYYVTPEKAELPSEVDWRTSGYVTPVKDQGQCGSCWAFSTTGALEGQHFRRTGQLVSLSEQNLVDCAWPEGCRGCGGCWPRFAMDYIKTNPGVDREDCYPYYAKNGNCHFRFDCIGATQTGYIAIPKGDENALQAAVANVGPISVAIDATRPEFQQYRSGVYDDPGCSPTALDHAVLVVGYGTEDGKDYWLVKNSWSASWGDRGYIKMARNKRNMCGIATYAEYPTV